MINQILKFHDLWKSCETNDENGKARLIIVKKFILYPLQFDKNVFHNKLGFYENFQVLLKNQYCERESCEMWIFEGDRA